MENLNAHSADFRQFFLAHYETLCVRAFRLVHDRKLSEDIVQDVFLMLWERREEIDFSRPVLPYLMTAVRNRSIDCLRSRKSHGEGSCGLDTLDGYVRRLSPTAAKGSSTFRGLGTRSTTAYRSSPSSAGACLFAEAGRPD